MRLGSRQKNHACTPKFLPMGYDWEGRLNLSMNGVRAQNLSALFSLNQSHLTDVVEE